MDIFETATRKKLRFKTDKGDMTAEQLWDIPLTSRTGFDLDTIAKGINSAVKSSEEESFVAPQQPDRYDFRLKLDIVKRIIAVKLEDAAKAKDAIVRAEKRRKLLDALSAKDDQALAAASREDILKQLAEIDAAA